MARTKSANAGTAVEACAGCRVDSLVSVDERGQMVLPKELRVRAGIEPGDKLAVVCHERDGEVCCLTMFKVDQLSGMVREMLGPLMKEML